MVNRSAINDFIRFLGTANLTKLTNLVQVYSGMVMSRILRKPIVYGVPHTLSVEPTTRCTLACPECPVGNNTLQRPGGEISLRLFRKILEDHDIRKIAHLILYFQGEPFLAKHFFDMVQAARKKNLYVSTSTNGQLLTQEYVDQILESGLDRLIISIDGVTQETYARYRKGGDLKRVVDGVSLLMRERKTRKQNHPYVIMQCLLFAHNEHEVSEIRKLARKLGVDKLVFKTAQFYHLDKHNGMIPSTPAYSRYKFTGGRYVLKKKQKNFCSRIWTTAVITWEGILVPCCFDKNARHPSGNLNAVFLGNAWKSEKMYAFRQQVLRDRKSIEICSNCTE